MISKYFTIQELVPREAFNYLGVDKCIWLIDPRLLTLLDVIREHFNVPVTINNWSTDGQYNESGFRLCSTKTGATMSQHKFGRAGDMKFEGLTDYDAIRKEIQANWPKFKEAGLTTIEATTPTWLHVDIRFTGSDDLLIVPFR